MFAARQPGSWPRSSRAMNHIRRIEATQRPRLQAPAPRKATSPTAMAAMATEKRSAPNTPCSSTIGWPIMKLSARPPSTQSPMASTVTWSAMEPKRLLTAMSAAPAKPAVRDTPISGSEVMPPSSSMPAKADPMPVSRAMSSTCPASRVPAHHTAAPPAAMTRRFMTRGSAAKSGSIGGSYWVRAGGRPA